MSRVDSPIEFLCGNSLSISNVSNYKISLIQKICCTKYSQTQSFKSERPVRKYNRKFVISVKQSKFIENQFFDRLRKFNTQNTSVYIYPLVVIESGVQSIRYNRLYIICVECCVAAKSTCKETAIN